MYKCELLILSKKVYASLENNNCNTIFHLGFFHIFSALYI